MRQSIALTASIAILVLVVLPVYATDSNFSYDLNASNTTNTTNSTDHPHLTYDLNTSNTTNSSTNHTHLISDSNTSNTTNSTNHTHSNTTVNSSGPSHAHANLTLAATFIQSNNEEVTVTLEDYEKNNPLTVMPPGMPLRFFKINAQNISYESIALNATYCEMDIKGTDEEKLAIFRYEANNSTWVMLPTNVNKEENILNASVNSLSLFAVSSHSENTSAHIHNDTAQAGKSHNCENVEDEPISASFISGESKLTLEIESDNTSDSSPPGSLIKFFSISARNFSYSGVSIKAGYNDAVLKGANESSLSILHYTNSTWVVLPTEVNTEENTLKASVDSLSLFAISSFSGTSTGSMGMGIVSNCLRCHGSNSTAFGEGMMGSIPKVNESIMNLSIHLNLNNASSNLNQACWACHANSTTPPKKHPPMFKASALTCSTCHVNGIGKFNPPRTTEHTLHAANITVNATCQLCHGKPQMINFNGSTTNSTISHYGKNRTDMLDLNKTSTNCSYCHQNPASEFSDVFNKTSRTNITHDGGISCSSCHGTGRLHNSTLTNMQGFSLSNCVQCHGTSGFAPKKIDENVINLSIHANLNNASSNINRACWACHSNSSNAPNTHPSISMPANTCSTCHVNNTVIFSAPKTTEHTRHAVNITVNATCQLCHGKPQMINLNGSTLNSTISHYGKNRTGMLDLNKTSTSCSYCHQNPASEFSDVFNKASRTNITHNGDLSCSSCHGIGRLHNSTLANMRGYSLSNCVQCHGTSGFALNKVSESSINQSIHANLNNASSNLNQACWACHSNIVTTPEKHPDITKLPNSCSKCHIDGALNLTQKQKGVQTVHVSSHSPESQKIRTPACTLCHSNDVLASGKTINSTVSHYAQYPKVDTRDCVSCHQNKEIGKKWGSPPDPIETIRLSNVEKKLVSDDIWKINQNYSIAISEVDKEGQSAWLELYYNGKLIQKELVPEGGSFKYDTKLVQEGGNKTIIDLRIDDIFYGGTVSLITFSGLSPKHIHTETSSVQCYACHVKEYMSDMPDGQRYFVLKKESQNVTLNQLDIDFTSSERKTLYSNNSWDMGSGYKLSIKDFSLNREYVWLVLTQNDILVKEDFVREGDYFTYNTTLNGVDITMFRLKVANLFVKG